MDNILEEYNSLGLIIDTFTGTNVSKKFIKSTKNNDSNHNTRNVYVTSDIYNRKYHIKGSL